MRGKGKGQQFDRLWHKLNDLYHTYWFVGRDIKNDLNALKNAVISKKPKSDYERKDQSNLLEQIEMLVLRNAQLQKELEREAI